MKPNMKFRVVSSIVLIGVLIALFANAVFLSRGPSHKKNEVVVTYGMEMNEWECGAINRAIDQQRKRGGQYLQGRVLIKFISQTANYSRKQP